MRKIKKQKRMHKKVLITFVKVAAIIQITGALAGCEQRNIVFEGASEEVFSDLNQNSADVVTLENEVTASDNTVMADMSGNVEENIKDDTICYVDVCGAVVSPGVYEVEDGTRVYEILQLAGGMTPEAEKSCINQAIAIYDGLKLIIPTATEWAAGEYTIDENQFVTRITKDRNHANGEQAEQDDGLVDINKASVEQLCTLPGVGLSKAESIIAYREEHGFFTRIEDIKNVSGIKEGLFEKIKSKIKV